MNQYALSHNKRRPRAANDNSFNRKVTLVQFKVDAPSAVEIEIFGGMLAELDAANDNEVRGKAS